MPYLDANGASLHYELSGDGAAVLVLIHEMGGSLRSWDEVVPGLGTRYRVLRHDMRGAGLSEKIRAGYTLADTAADLDALLDGLGITTPVHLAGCAVGACVALHFAATRHGRVRSLVAMAPSTGIRPEARGWVLDWAARIEREGMRPFVDDEMAPNAYPPVLRTDPDRFARFRGQQLANDPASFVATYRLLLGSDVGERLGDIACPTLLVAGIHDVPRSPAFVEMLLPRFRDARMAVVDSGHFMAVQTPALVADTLMDFFAQQD